MELEYEFEWDERKNIINQRKHGVSFEVATLVFYDPGQLCKFDWKHSVNEDRWKMTGRANWKILTVSYTVRNGKIRIFSAKKAEKEDKEEYENGYGTIYEEYF